MNVATRSVFAALAILGSGTVARDASANALDDPGSGYPTEVEFTSPSPTYDSQFEFNATHSIDAGGFTIDADFNSDGTLAAVNSVSGMPNAVATGATMPGGGVNATLEWQASGNSGAINLVAPAATVSLSLRFKINFTGNWKAGSETCRTNAFTITMNNTGNTYPNPSLGGLAYSFTNGSFRIVSNGFYIPAIAGTTCTAAHVAALLSDLDVGKTTGAQASGMKFDVGFAKYTWNGNFLSGS